MAVSVLRPVSEAPFILLPDCWLVQTYMRKWDVFLIDGQALQWLSGLVCVPPPIVFLLLLERAATLCRCLHFTYLAHVAWVDRGITIYILPNGHFWFVNWLTAMKCSKIVLWLSRQCASGLMTYSWLCRVSDLHLIVLLLVYHVYFMSGFWKCFFYIILFWDAECQQVMSPVCWKKYSYPTLSCYHCMENLLNIDRCFSREGFLQNFDSDPFWWCLDFIGAYILKTFCSIKRWTEPPLSSWPSIYRPLFLVWNGWKFL